MARTTRARPQICSQVTGLRLCGMAELPFWPRAKYSSASRTSVRCRWRTSSAIFSHSAVASASAETKCAWRSRWITCEATGAGLRSRRSQISSSVSGPMWAKVPTAPEILPTRRSSAAARRRARLRPASSYQMASFRPKVMGSAWTPWVRPICTVCLNSSARRLSTSRRSSRSCRTMADGLLQDQRLGGIHDVVGSQAVVEPARRFGVPGGGHGFGHRGGEGDDVVLDVALDFVDALDVEAGVGAQEARGLVGDHAEFGEGLAGGELDFEPLLELVLVAPDPAHFGPRVSGNHDLSIEIPYSAYVVPQARAGSRDCAVAGLRRPPSVRSRDDCSVR